MVLGASVARSFRKCQDATEALVGPLGIVLVFIYVALVGTGTYFFFVTRFPLFAELPEPLLQLGSTGSPTHILLGFPGALLSCIFRMPMNTLLCGIDTAFCLLVVSNMAFHYYMAVTQSPGTVADGISANERRTGLGSASWWRSARARVNRVSWTSSVNMVQDKVDERNPFDTRASFRFCHKCNATTMSNALSMLPTELRAIERRNRMASLRPDLVTGANDSENLADYEADEGEPEVRAWLGEEEAMRMVPPPKPERAHHCKTCRACILKYDHHCPWINQCVGLGNERYFILFMLWMAIGSAFYVGSSWRIAWQAVRAKDTWDYALAPRVLYLVIYTKAAFMGTAVGLLACYQLWLVSRGETHTENQDNTHYNKIARRNGRSFVNVYDLGMLRNLQVFFNVGPGLDYPYYTLLLPMRIPPYSDGWHWAKRAGLCGRHGGVESFEEFTDEEPDS